jgi:hypothetical protein
MSSAFRVSSCVQAVESERRIHADPKLGPILRPIGAALTLFIFIFKSSSKQMQGFFGYSIFMMKGIWSMVLF